VNDNADIVAVLRQEIGALREAVRSLGAECHDLITPETAAERLDKTATKITRLMNANTLPRGVVWFELPGLGRYFSWRRLTELIMSDPGLMSAERCEEGNDPDYCWRKPA